MGSYVNDEGIPLGFGMALAQNTEALDVFSSLSQTQKQAIIDGAHHVQSKQEMRGYVDSIKNRSF